MKYLGICKLCEQLNLDPLEDVRVLVLLWKLGANKKPTEIQKEEFIAGCHKLQIDSIAKFKALLPGLDTGFMDREEFSDFFKVCYFLGLLFVICIGCFVSYLPITPCRLIYNFVVSLSVPLQSAMLTFGYIL